MRVPMIAAIAAAATLAGCSTYGTDSRYRGYSAYDYNRVDPAYNGYYADRYYVDGPRYRERRLSSRDRIYRGENGQYYCRRNDGTTGLIVGGAAGGILGNLIDGGHSRIVGTLLGGAAGALAGKSIDQNQSEIRCR